MKHTHTWTAEDGTTFDTVAECKKYEEIVGLCDILSLARSPIEIRAAIEREKDYLDLADAIERAGNIIAAKRRARGELKKAKKGSIEAVAKAIGKQRKGSK